MELIACAVIVGWLGWLAYRRSVEGLKARSKRNETVQKVVERFSSSEELVAFIRSAEGRELLLDASAEAGSPRRSILRFVQSGIITATLGVAFLLNALRLSGATDLNDIREAAELRYWGTAGVALGVGLLVVAVVSWFLARRWGMLEPKR